MQRGHWNPSDFAISVLAPCNVEFDSKPPRSSDGCGNGDWSVELEATCLLVTLEMEALSICVKAGLIPHARHGGKGVCALAVVGSKLDGRGFGKLHMVQIHVAELGCGVPVEGDRNWESDVGKGDPVLSREPDEVAAAALDWRDPFLAGLGISVTFAEDLRNPAYGRS